MKNANTSFSMKNRLRSLSPVVLVLVVMLSAGVATAQTFAYITDPATDAVLVYDASTYAFVTSVSVSPGTPNRIAVTPDQAFAYVTLTDTDRVAVIDTATNTLVATVGVGLEPQGLAVTPDGAFVYVVDSHATSLSVISTATNTVAATVFLESPAWGVAITPDGASAYATNVISQSVEVVDTATNTQSNNIETLSPLSHPAITPDGAFVYVPAGSGTGATQVISTATNTVVATIPGAVTVFATPANTLVMPIATGGAPLDVAFAVKTPAGPTSKEQCKKSFHGARMPSAAKPLCSLYYNLEILRVAQRNSRPPVPSPRA